MSARRYYRRNTFHVFVGDERVPGIVRVYRDVMGLKVTRFHRSDAEDFVSAFGDSGVLTIVVMDRNDEVARAFRIEYDGVAWDPVHLSALRDTRCEEAVVLTPAGEWAMCELDETHEYIRALRGGDVAAPPASTLVVDKNDGAAASRVATQAASKKPSKKKTSKKK